MKASGRIKGFLGREIEDLGDRLEGMLKSVRELIGIGGLAKTKKVYSL